MPHYKDGTQAFPGDIAKGKGYNTPYEVQGVILQIKEAETCNLIIGIPHLGEYGRPPLVDGFALSGHYGAFDLVKGDGRVYPVSLTTEYGDVKDFELVYRAPVKATVA